MFKGWGTSILTLAIALWCFSSFAKAQTPEFAIQDLKLEDKFVPAGPAAPGMTTQDNHYYLVSLRVANWEKSSDRAVVRVIFDGHIQREFNLNRSAGINFAQTPFQGRVDYTPLIFGQSGFTNTMIIRLFKNTTDPQNLVESKEVKKPNVVANEQAKEQASQNIRLTAVRAETSNSGVDIHWQLNGIPKASDGYKIVISQDSKTIAQYEATMDVQTGHVKGKQDDTFTVTLFDSAKTSIDSLTTKAGLPGVTSLTTAEDQPSDDNKNSELVNCGQFIGFNNAVDTVLGKGLLRFEPLKYFDCHLYSFVTILTKYIVQLVPYVPV